MDAFLEKNVSLYASFIIFCVGFVGSLFYTLSSGYIGNYLQGDYSGEVPLKLIITNAVFDGLTLYFTAFILRWGSVSWRARSAMIEFEHSFKSLAHSYDSNFRAMRSDLHSYYDIKTKKLVMPDSKLLELRNNLEIYSELPSIAEQERKGFDFNSIHLKKLTSIFSVKSEIAFDQCLYRNVVENDHDITLLRYGLASNSEAKYYIQRSWFAAVISSLEKDVSGMNNELEKLIKSQQSKKGISTQEKIRLIEHKHIELSENLDFSNFNKLMQATWKAIDENRKVFWLRPFLALIFDILAAGLFAYCAIYIGLFGTSSELDFSALNSLFVGGYQNFEFTNIGPMFWIMHTTFIPTILIWFVLIILMVCAFIVNPLVNKIASFFLKDVNNNTVPENVVFLSTVKNGTLISGFATVCLAIYRISTGSFV